MHHVVDDVWIRENPESVALLGRGRSPWRWARGRRGVRTGAQDDAYVMRTAHEDELLDEALWFAVFNTYVEEHDLSNVLAVVSPQYAEHVERRFADSVGLNRDGDEP